MASGKRAPPFCLRSHRGVATDRDRELGRHFIPRRVGG